ncbi:MAG: UvrD-helicase domain-containing protein [Lentisphaerae bacterium]|nr:UvrD-helicase domain-containing protein [Lentisphaerota bacterium]
MSDFQHKAISASAGSGKTFQLADRFVRLLAAGVPPDRIAALTFSRKAAGEIFDRIVAHLCAACTSPAEAAAVATRIGLPATSVAAFTAALRAMMDHLPRLHIGTLDSFIVGVLRAFPTELGVPTDFQMLDENSTDAARMRERVLDRIFNPLTVDQEIQARFFEAFKQATFGKEEKDMERYLHQFVQTYRAFYQVLPLSDAWGDESVIWPAGSRWLVPTENVTATANRLIEQIEAKEWPTKFSESLQELVMAAAHHTPASHWNGTLWRKTISVQIMEQLPELEHGQLSISYNRKVYELDAGMCAGLLTVLTHMLGIELRNALRRTAGIHQLLDQFEVHYDALMRRSGSMTFADAQYLLTEANRYSDGACLSRLAGVEGRLYIDYRLDCKLDHWLLDEFQDTSDLQWAVLRNLVDEILQDSSATRSFFYVGDVKQAIYGWRGGNPHLFGEILSDYGSRITEMPLATSYRSVPAIIDTVNAAFDALPEERLGAAVIAQWNQTWHHHDCAPHLHGRSGYATIVEPQPPLGQTKPSADDRYHTVAALLREIDPIRRGLETAILVRRNETGRLLVDLLRQRCPDIPVTHEGKATLRGNGVVELMLSLLAFAAHPGDRFAWRHIQMSPLNAHLQAEGLTRHSLPLVLLSDIHAIGFGGFVRTWGAHLTAQHPLDAYAQHGLNDLAEAAVLFDRSGDCDPDAFRQFIDSYALPATPTPHVVRVMTIHQSKGLGFDIVILPELDGSDITKDQRRSMLLSRDEETRRPQWILSLPNTTVTAADSTLARRLDAADVESCFENLCVLYVAMTRAKRGLYAVTSFAGPTAKSFTGSEFIKQQLRDREEPITIDGCPATLLYESGERDWYRESPIAARDPAPAVASAPNAIAATGLQPLQRLEPSSGDRTARGAAWLFNEAARDVLDFGSAIHELFEQIEWIEEADVEAIVAQWQTTTRVSAAVARDALAQFREALISPEAIQALSRPASPTRLWREKRFHFTKEDRLVSGVFDRVAISLDEKEQPTAAMILDFKSDQVSSDSELSKATERHREQLALYSEALARILSIEPSQITAGLLFTRLGRVVTC